MSKKSFIIIVLFSLLMGSNENKKIVTDSLVTVSRFIQFSIFDYMSKSDNKEFLVEVDLPPLFNIVKETLNPTLILLYNSEGEKIFIEKYSRNIPIKKYSGISNTIISVTQDKKKAKYIIIPITCNTCNKNMGELHMYVTF